MSNKIPNIKERIMYFAEKEEVSKQVFCKKIGMTYGNFTGESKERPINSTAIENILLNYPQINLYWLITGKGDILRDSDEINGDLTSFKEQLGDKNEIITLLKEKITKLEKENTKLKKEKETPANNLYVAEPIPELKEESKTNSDEH